MTRVREDRHGLFVVTDGSVFRPQPALHEYPIAGRTYTSVLAVGQTVTARHRAQTPFAQLRGEVNGQPVEEWWGSHGTRWGSDGSTLPSDAVWDPPSNSRC